ncbi:glutaredoxin family protein [Clostridium lacusfryxellense]|uniref:glutaredoxin family protein n=1 Tax=Clostridium lacusfryxellense TaxID=205328 RepID=UPI001C0AE7AA|nr:glutaredoxin family protein [Clostridium lacusfryxellense]MBU3111195.1 glutaredoxin family protein [Clostridium lacusfryxellense]
MNKVEIYTSNSCGFCHLAKEFFEENNIEYIEHNISENVDAKKALIKKGYRSVPVIDINGNEMVGFDKEKVVAILGL